MQTQHWARPGLRGEKPCQDISAGNENKRLFLTAGKRECLILLQKAQQPPASGAEKYSPQHRGKITSFLSAALCREHAFRNALQKPLPVIANSTNG